MKSEGSHWGRKKAARKLRFIAFFGCEKCTCHVKNKNDRIYYFQHMIFQNFLKKEMAVLIQTDVFQSFFYSICKMLI